MKMYLIWFGNEGHNSDFLSKKSAESLQFFFIEEYKIGGLIFIFDLFDNFDLCTLFSKNEPKFWHLIANQTKSLENFNGRFHIPLGLLIHP